MNETTLVPGTEAVLLDGKAAAATLRKGIAASVQRMVAAGHRAPGLTAVLVGENPASKVYVGSKTRGCKEVGMVGDTVQLPETATADQIRETVDRLNADPNVDGILIQLPLPAGLPERELLDRIDPDKDVDGFHPINVGRLWLDEEGLTPATPTGVVELLDLHDIELSGKHAVIVGRSAIVGKPMAGLLLRRNCTVTICHSRTRDLPGVCRQADILIAAVGRTGLVGADHVRDGAVVIDVGMNRITDEAELERFYPGDTKRRATFERRGSVLTGDVDFVRVAPKAAAITPVPGGVGPLTVAMVLGNTLRAGRRRQGLPARETS